MTFYKKMFYRINLDQYWACRLEPEDQEVSSVCPSESSLRSFLLKNLTGSIIKDGTTRRSDWLISEQRRRITRAGSCRTCTVFTVPPFLLSISRPIGCCGWETDRLRPLLHLLHFDLQVNLFLHQDFSVPVGNAAGEDVSVYGTTQCQTEVSQLVFIHPCSVSVEMVLFQRQIRTILIHMDHPSSVVPPLHSSIFRQAA